MALFSALKIEKTGPVTQEDNASALFGAASSLDSMNFLDMHMLLEADHLISDYVMHPTLRP